MAAYGSIATNTAAGAGNLTITKPASLAAGDLMIAVIAQHDTSASPTLTGWTLKDFIADGSSANVACLVKVADAGDAAASDFTFTCSGNEKAGFIIRLTGTFASADNIQSSDFTLVATDTTPTYTPGITTRHNNDLLVMVVAEQSNTSVSGYAVANSNPVSWDERADFALNDAEDWTIGVATATYATAGATGDFSAALGVSSQSFGILLGVSDTTSVTPAPAVVTATFSVQAPGVSGGASVSTAVVTMTVSVQTPTVTTALPKYRNTDKSTAASITNLDKS